MYIGVSASKFDDLRNRGLMPKPKRIDGRKVWDVRKLDLAFEALPDEDGGGSSWEDA
jgi:exosome complex RNA-binding protein Rrp42 (RNase PH superfamily)